jgi:RNA polymerase sigma-70 factor (ECF subfamily)
LELVENQAQLIDQARNGNDKAFQNLFEAYQRPVYNFIYRMIGNEEDAEDVTQEVFFKVYKKLASLREAKFFSTWLFSIAKNEAVTASRRKNRRLATSLHEFDDNQEVTVLGDVIVENPENDIVNHEFEEIIQDILLEIPEIYRTAFVLGAIQRYPYEKVAEMLGCSIGNIKSRVFRARAQIAKKLKQYM